MTFFQDSPPETSGYVCLSVFHPTRCSADATMQEIAIAMRTSRGPVAMTETRGELLHLPLGIPVNTLHMDASCFITFFCGLALKIWWSF